MAAQIHGHDAVAGVDELRREEPVLFLQVAEPGNHDHQRAMARVGVGEGAAVAGKGALSLARGDSGGVIVSGEGG